MKHNFPEAAIFIFLSVSFISPQKWTGWENETSPCELVGARSLASLIPVSSMKKMKRAEQFSDDTDQPPRQQQCVRIGTEEVPLETEELYYNQLHWAS